MVIQMVTKIKGTKMVMEMEILTLLIKMGIKMVLVTLEMPTVTQMETIIQSEQVMELIMVITIVVTKTVTITVIEMDKAHIKT